MFAQAGFLRLRRIMLQLHCVALERLLLFHERSLQGG